MSEGLALLRKPFPVWRPVHGYEGMYSVSNLGEVRSEARTRKGKSGAPTMVVERILRPSRSKSGHLSVRLCDGTGKSTAFVHTLVLEGHIGPRPDGMQACHKNGNPADNGAANLRWGTAASNQRDRVAHGTSSRGVGNGSAKLSELQVLAIRADTRRHVEIASDHHVSRALVGLIRSGKAWSHIGETA